MKVINLRKANSGKLRAWFDVEFTRKDGQGQEQTILIARDFKLVESNSGLWPAGPSQSYQQGGQTKYKAIVEITDLKLLDRIGKEATAIYHGGK